MRYIVFLFLVAFLACSSMKSPIKSNNSFIGEICNNGIDDNGNGRIDCDDRECDNAPQCQDCTGDDCK